MSRVLPFPARHAAALPPPQFCPYEGYKLAFECHGDPRNPPVVLIHGILLDSACNRDLAIAIAGEGYHVILLELLGHGRSDKPGHAKELRIDFFAEQVQTLLDHLKIDRAFIGGVSLGAITSLQFAATQPERCKGLLLEMPVMERATPAAALLLIPVIAACNYAAPLVRGVSALTRRLPQPQNNTAQILYNGLGQQPEDIASIIHGVLVGPVVPPRRVRQKIQVPSLVIGHGGDWLHNLEDARRLAREMPRARFLKARSMLELRTKPERLLPKIINFIHQVERESAVA